MMTKGGLSAGESAMQPSLPKSTLEKWMQTFNDGKPRESVKATGHWPMWRQSRLGYNGNWPWCGWSAKA